MLDLLGILNQHSMFKTRFGQTSLVLKDIGTIFIHLKGRLKLCIEALKFYSFFIYRF